MRDLFRAAGVPGDDAETIAAAVVGQEIRGLTTHGLRMVDWNLKGLAEGRIRATPERNIGNSATSHAIFMTSRDRRMRVYTEMALR